MNPVTPPTIRCFSSNREVRVKNKIHQGVEIAQEDYEDCVNRNWIGMLWGMIIIGFSVSADAWTPPGQNHSI